MDYEFLQISLNVEMCQKYSQSIYGVLELAMTKLWEKYLGNSNFVKASGA